MVQELVDGGTFLLNCSWDMEGLETHLPGQVKAFIANHNIETVDLGVPVISMHAPYEVVSKADVYTAHKAFLAFNMA